MRTRSPTSNTPSPLAPFAVEQGAAFSYNGYFFFPIKPPTFWVTAEVVGRKPEIIKTGDSFLIYKPMPVQCRDRFEREVGQWDLTFVTLHAVPFSQASFLHAWQWPSGCLDGPNASSVSNPFPSVVLRKLEWQQPVPLAEPAPDC